MLALVVAPIFASSKTGGERAGCFNNMRLIGQAFASWAGDHQQRVPWRVSNTDGGTLPSTGFKPPAAWYEYSFISNELRTPKILACPADSRVVLEATFDQYKTSGYRENCISYTLGLEFLAEEPRGWLSSDMHLRTDATNGLPCSAKVTAFNRIDAVNSSVAWTNKIHGPNGGHVSLHDGSVAFVGSENLREVLTRVTDNGSTHFLKAR